MTPVLVDSGFLIALFDPADSVAASATRYLQRHKHPLATVSATVVETCFHFSPVQKAELLAWIRRGGISIADVPVSAYGQIELTLRKYADQEIDFVDAALVWLANETGARRILTVDRTDFEILRLKGGKRFELIQWF
jgi:predicted nucleic acid-binding protein